MALNLAACGSAPQQEEEKEPETASAVQEDTADKADDEPAVLENKTLVIVFSATGNTKAVAEKIAAVTDADMYEILAKETYTEADLDWHDKNSRTTIEQNDPSSRPEIGNGEVSLEEYTTIYIGYPIWWGEEPRIMDTFVERYDFTGITMIPFCTSGSSGIGRSGRNLEEKAGSGNWLEGARFAGSASEDEVRRWIDSLG
ncbi:MAG: flavodoxin [Oscillospiraceae bacterium]|nr:flavodoxin [Oscillospiraceae bacterium]